MTKITQKQFVKYAGQTIPLPRIGEECNGFAIVAINPIGKPYAGSLGDGRFRGVIQEFELCCESRN